MQLIDAHHEYPRWPDVTITSIPQKDILAAEQQNFVYIEILPGQIGSDHTLSALIDAELEDTASHGLTMKRKIDSHDNE